MNITPIKSQWSELVFLAGCFVGAAIALICIFLAYHFSVWAIFRHLKF